MATRMSHKVRMLKRRVLDAMLYYREDDHNYHYSVSAWVNSVNARREHNDPVTDPQVRRCLDLLVEEGKVVVRGYGRKGYRAITLAEKLAEADRLTKASDRDQLSTRLKDQGVRGDVCGVGIIVSVETAMALAEMLEDFPGIAEQYFVSEFPDEKDEDDGPV